MSEIGMVPPSDLDAEAVVLSACMLDPAVIDIVRPVLNPKHFYADANRRIFEAILALSDIGNPVDPVSIARWLSDRGHIQKIGGRAYLAQLIDATPATANVENHANSIVNKASIRETIRVCQTIVTEGYGDVGSVSEWLTSAEARVYDVTRTREINNTTIVLGDAALTEFRDMQDRAKHPDTVPGITTGLRGLDAKIGGWRRGAKYTIAARPGQGKSAFMLNAAVSAAEAGHGVVVVSIEMPREQLVQRIIAQIAHVRGEDMDRPHTLTSAQWRDIAAAIERIGKLPIVVVDAGVQSAATVRAAVREGARLLKRKWGEQCEVALVAIDYVQIMTGTGRGTRENEVSEISASNRALAKQENCAVLELSQLNRKVEERPDKRPVMADLRESGALEQDSFCILMLYRDDYYKPPEAIPDGLAEILIRKVRQYGSCGTVRVKFDGPTTNFFDDSEPGEFEDFRPDNF